MNDKDLPVQIETANPAKIYDYQSLILNGVCRSCLNKLQWKLGCARNEDDRFCYAECCHIRYCMVPEQVRVIASLASTFRDDEEEINETLMDSDFLDELRKL